MDFSSLRDWRCFLFRSLKEFLPQTYVKAQKIEKKILAKHKELKGFTELDAKVKYVKLARGLPTFGVHFFLVKVSHVIHYPCLKIFKLFNILTRAGQFFSLGMELVIVYT